MIENEIVLKEIYDSIRINEFSIYDAPRQVALENEIRRFISQNIRTKLNETFWKGNSAVTPEEFDGLYTQAPLYNYAGYVGEKYTDPDLKTLVSHLKAEIEEPEPDKYTVDFVMINPKTATFLREKKDVDGRRIFSDNESLENILGVQYVKVTGYVSPNEMLIGDSEVFEILDAGDIELEVGRNKDDFGRYHFTIRGMKRAALLLRKIDRGGVFKIDNIAAALADISI